MFASIASSGANHPIAAAPAFIASLIESAVDSLEVDRNMSREQLLLASALLRAQATPRSAGDDALTRARLAAWQTNRVTEHIERNLEPGVDVGELARMVNLSPSHFFRAFKATVGFTPCQYITQRRIALAIRLMSTTAQPLSHIALACGLCDQSHFCRVFNRVVGVSPGVWRRANATGPAAHKGRIFDDKCLILQHLLASGATQ